MWNIVKVDGKYYYYDSTVAACIKENSKYYYDGLRQSNFSNYSTRYNWFPRTTTNELYSEDELNN